MIKLVIDGCAVWESGATCCAEQTHTIRDGQDAAGLFSVIAKLPQEAFAILALDAGNHPLGEARIATLGLLNSNQVHPREVFAEAIADRAASIIVAHNHPSGSLESSSEDRALTKRLIKAGEILGIPLLDHLIFAPSGEFISLKGQGEM